MQDPVALAGLFQQGLAHHQRGQREEAKVAYERMLVLQPGHPDALHMLGVIALQVGNSALAAELISIALQNNPLNASAHHNLGLALQELQRFEEAIVSFTQAVSIKEDYAQAIFNRGLALHAAGRLDHALADFDKTIELQPHDAQAWNSRGVVLQDQLRWDEAVQSYAAAIAAQPAYAQAYYNQGNALLEAGRFEAALASYDAAIGLQADWAHALNNRGLALQELQRSHEAIESYDAAIASKPDYADAYWNKAIELLLCGDFAQGWKLYEWRWRRDTFSSRKRDFLRPLWLGDAPLDGKTVLLHAEQGLGDSIQFCRYAREVAALGAEILLEVPRPLMALFETLEGVKHLVEKGSALPHFDFHCPLLSLPLAFQTQLTKLPSTSTYLASTASKRDLWQSHLGPPSKPRIGLVWSGNARDKNDLQRSMTLNSLLPYLPHCFEYICLQKELRAADHDAMQANPIRFFGLQIQDFSDTAALCDLMDLVISVDTSVAHLAGALGKPTWIMLPYAPDWRWMRDRDDSPWYPSARLYRQGKDRSWLPVLERIASDLIGYGHSRIPKR